MSKVASQPLHFSFRPILELKMFHQYNRMFLSVEIFPLQKFNAHSRSSAEKYFTTLSSIVFQIQRIRGKIMSRKMCIYVR